MTLNRPFRISTSGKHHQNVHWLFSFRTGTELLPFLSFSLQKRDWLYPRLIRFSNLIHHPAARRTSLTKDWYIVKMGWPPLEAAVWTDNQNMVLSNRDSLVTISQNFRNPHWLTCFIEGTFTFSLTHLSSQYCFFPSCTRTTVVFQIPLFDDICSHVSYMLNKYAFSLPKSSGKI